MKRHLFLLCLPLLLGITACEKTNFPAELAGTTWDAFCLYTDGYFSYICLDFIDLENFNATFANRDDKTTHYEGTYHYQAATHQVWLTFGERQEVLCNVQGKVFTYYDERGHVYELTRNRDQ